MNTASSAFATGPSEPELLAKLTQIARHWDRRAQVRRADVEIAGIELVRDVPDFRQEALPFFGHATLARLDPADASYVLTCGWLIFNLKVISTEQSVLIPACIKLLERFDAIVDAAARDIVAQTLVDESFHVLLVQRANTVTMNHRNVLVRLPAQSTMLRRLRAHQAACTEGWQRDLSLIGAAVVTEVFIKGYLSQLSSATDIQPLNVAITRVHLADERAHGGIFRVLAEMLFRRLDAVQSSFLVDVMVRAMSWFSEPDFAAWRSMLAGRTRVSTGSMLDDVELAWRDESNYAELEAFLSDVGVRGVEEKVAAVREAARRPSPRSWDRR